MKLVLNGIKKVATIEIYTLLTTSNFTVTQFLVHFKKSSVTIFTKLRTYGLTVAHQTVFWAMSPTLRDGQEDQLQLLVINTFTTILWIVKMIVPSLHQDSFRSSGSNHNHHSQLTKVFWTKLTITKTLRCCNIDKDMKVETQRWKLRSPDIS